MKEKIFQRNKKKMGHLRQLILFEKSYLYKRYNNCLNIKLILNVAVGVLCIFGHRNKQKKTKKKE